MHITAAEELPGASLDRLVEHGESEVGGAVEEGCERGRRRSADLGLRIGDDPMEGRFDERQPRWFLREEFPNGEHGRALL